MPSTKKLLSSLKADYPQFFFKQADSFLWSPKEQTIYYANIDKKNDLFLLHELAHGLINHSDYDHDIRLLAMEREAWDEVIKLAKKYDLSISDDFIQLNLDTYRDWLHSRSTCPKCQASGVQIDKLKYECLVCGNKWLVNESRVCALRRYSIENNKITR